MTAKLNPLPLRNCGNNRPPNCLNFSLFLFPSLCCLLWLFVITARIPCSLHKQAQNTLHNLPAVDSSVLVTHYFIIPLQLGLAYCFSQPQQPTTTHDRFKMTILQNYCQQALLDGTVAFLHALLFFFFKGYLVAVNNFQTYTVG